ncbi:MAG: hypothetical protein IJ788_00005, partial [Oscillospiraceae bacterium]|nr:hypothetical protein [Oscillospiraceae bacterium]
MKKILGIISFALSVLMLYSLAATALAANKGTADEPFVISSASLTGYSMATGGNFALGKTGSNLSKSYVETNTTGVSYLTAQSVTATGVVVGDDEFVELSVDLPTSIKGSGTLSYNVSNGRKTITGVAQSTTTGVSFNNLVVVQGKTAPVQGYFKSVSGRVRPVGDVTLGGTYTVVGASGEADAKNVTVNGNAIISGYFNKLTVNPGAQVSVIGTTVIGTVEQKEGSNITVNKGVKLTIDGNVMQPVEAQTITSWKKINGYYLLPAGNYTVASGAWQLEGNTTVKSTGSADISVSLEGSTLTVENGTVKARGGAAADATGTVISTAGKVKLSTIEKGVWAYGEFKEISTVVNSVQYPITVPKDKTISAEYKDGDNPVVINSVTVKQDTEFKEWNGILPAGSNYKYENISGSWKGETTDTPSQQIAVTYTGNGNSLTITQDNAAVQGTFTELNTGDHEVTVVGDLTADKANAKLKGTEGVSVTIKSGEGALTGAFKDISLKGATAESKFNIDVTKAESLQIESGEAVIKGKFTEEITVTDCSKYALDVTGKPDLVISGGEGTVKGVFGDISITDSIYAVTDTTADTLTVVMSSKPQKENTIQGAFGEITVTGDKYALDVTGNPTFTAQDSEGTITGSLKDITITDGSYSIADTTAESLTVTMSEVPQNANTVSGAFSKKISLTGDKYVLDVTGSPTFTAQDSEGTIRGSLKDITITDGVYSISDVTAESLTVTMSAVPQNANTV